MMKNEVWLIDFQNLELYRTISEKQEQAIPILNNPVMNKFICIGDDELKTWIDNSMIEGAK